MLSGQDSKPEKLLYSINDAAYALSVSRVTIYAEINADRLKYIQFKHRKFITHEALIDWIRDREIESVDRQSTGSLPLSMEAHHECA